MTAHPKALAHAPPALLARLHTVLTDIDDTLTSGGRLPAAAYCALERLSDAGLKVIAVTGRPAGWCDLIARFWPVAGVVGENGAFAFRYDHAARRMERRYALSADERRAGRARLEALRLRILAEVPGAAVSADQAYREADLAIDFCEDVPRLPPEAVAKIVALFTHSGATAKVSSIHVNGWFGAYDKLTTARAFLAGAFAVDIETDKSRVAFIGDSPNDAPLFAALPVSVGVANVLDFAGAIDPMPAFVTAARGGAGFAECADAILKARAAL